MPIKPLIREEILHEEIDDYFSMSFNLLSNYLRTIVNEDFKFFKQGNENVSSFVYGSIFSNDLVIVACYDETENKNKIKDINPKIILKFIFHNKEIKKLVLTQYGLKVHYMKRKVNLGDFLGIDLTNKEVYVMEIFGEKKNFELFEKDFKSAIVDSLLS